MSTIASSAARPDGFNSQSPKQDLDIWTARWAPLRHLSDGSLSALCEASSRLTLTRHQHVFRQGESLDRLYFVERGSVKLVRHSEAGKELIVRVVTTGDTFGAVAAPRESESLAQALEDTTLVVLPIPAIHRAIHENALFAVDLVALAETSLRTAETVAFRIAFDTVPARLARVLLDESDETSGALRAPLNQTELAHLIGSSRETVCSILNRFRRNGLLHIERGRLRILSRDALLRAR